MTHSLHPLHVLLIDDEQADLDLLRLAFKGQAHPTELLTASGGHAALDLLREGTPVDLIVLDLFMPGMDGFEVLRAVKASPELHLIPVVVLSNSQREEDITRAYEAYASAVLVKPTHLEALQRLVEALLAYWRHARLIRRPDAPYGTDP